VRAWLDSRSFVGRRYAVHEEGGVRGMYSAARAVAVVVSRGCGWKYSHGQHASGLPAA
jgi:hypothetical protein